MKQKSRLKTQQRATRIFSVLAVIAVGLMVYGELADVKKALVTGLIATAIAMIGLMSS